MNKKIFAAFILCLSWSTVSLGDLYSKVNQEVLSAKQIASWIEQFDEEDRATASLLADQIEFYSYPKIMQSLIELHQRLLLVLEQDGYFQNEKGKDPFEKVDFSKTYPAKSGDLISYFYRSANKVRAVSFKNLSDLELDPRPKNSRAIVLLDDYLGTGTQFLEFLGGEKNGLLNQYGRIYVVTLVANKSAISKFELISQGKNDIVAQKVIETIGVKDPEFIRHQTEVIHRIPGKRVKLIPFSEESHIVNGENALSSEQKEQLNRLLAKYSSEEYMGEFSKLGGHTVFFYGSPNLIPEIFWNSRTKIPGRTTWNPLFRRVEDISMYKIADLIPIDQHVY